MDPNLNGMLGIDVYNTWSLAHDTVAKVSPVELPVLGSQRAHVSVPEKVGFTTNSSQAAHANSSPKIFCPRVATGASIVNDRIISISVPRKRHTVRNIEDDTTWKRRCAIYSISYAINLHNGSFLDLMMQTAEVQSTYFNLAIIAIYHIF